ARWAARGLVPRGAAGKAAGATPLGPGARRREWLVPAREFQGDEPLTREAMAGYVARLAERPEALPAGDTVLLAHLVREYAPELRRAGHDPDRLRQSLEAAPEEHRHTSIHAVPGGYGLVRLGGSTEGGGTIRGVYRAAGVLSV